jgi:hypothetical protein
VVYVLESGCCLRDMQALVELRVCGLVKECL